MIKINLLPEELRIIDKGGGFRPEHLLYLIPAVFAVLIVAHIFLGIGYISLLRRYDRLNLEWKKGQPQAAQIAELKKESQSAVLPEQRLNWSEKLNLLSMKLPAGVWFNGIALTDKEFVLKGSVVSSEKQELTLINKFLAGLKNDGGFFMGFAGLELGPLKKDNIGGCDIVDFSLKGTMK